MSGKAMRLKANIRNLAKKKNMSAQVVLQCVFGSSNLFHTLKE
jgi:hypothetical protein